MEPKWTPAETAGFLRLSEQTLANWRWRGCGPPYLKINGAIRYDPEVVREWTQQLTRLSTSDAGTGQ